MSRLVLLFSLLASAAHANPQRDAQVELATYGALLGLGLGVHTSVETDVNLRPAAWITAATTGAGLWGGLLLADDLDISPAGARQATSLGAWAMAETVLLGAWVGPWEDELTWFALGAGVLGAGAGLALTANGHTLSLGDVSMINSGGIWMVPTGLLLGYTFHLGSGKHIERDIFLLAQAGLATGALLAAWHHPTREQVLTLDLGLLAGGLGGGLLGLIASIYSDAFEPFTALTALGMGVGAWIALESTGFGGGKDEGKAVEAGRMELTLPIMSGTW